MKSRFWNSEKDSKNHERKRFQSENKTFIKKKQRNRKEKELREWKWKQFIKFIERQKRKYELCIRDCWWFDFFFKNIFEIKIFSFFMNSRSCSNDSCMQWYHDSSFHQEKRRKWTNRHCWKLWVNNSIIWSHSDQTSKRIRNKKNDFIECLLYFRIHD